LATLSDMIRQARNAKGLSQYQLADTLGVRNIAVSAWETGKNNPSPENMVELIRVLDLDEAAAASAYLEAWRRR
jgi:transcriptional regulator with XRE-family HTH domain